jgi:hypothetical protein
MGDVATGRSLESDLYYVLCAKEEEEAGDGGGVSKMWSSSWSVRIFGTRLRWDSG